MKKILFLILLIAVTLPVFSQADAKRHGKKHKDITELVDNLTPVQKRKIENITKESVERVAVLRQRQKEIRDSINDFMNRDGDQSTVLYPLFDREAAVKVAVSREMYATKRSIDEVLTKEQRASLRNAFGKEKKHQAKRKE